MRKAINNYFNGRKKIKGRTIHECYQNVVAQESKGWECVKPITRVFDEVVTANPNKKGRDYKRAYAGGEYWFAVMVKKNKTVSGV